MKLRILALTCVFFAASATAVEVTTLFTAEVPYDRSARDARARAYEEALANVLLRVSGPELVGDTDLYEALFPEPERFVIRFRQGSDETLFVTFDGDALTTLLRESGQTVWGRDRPLTLVWLAVDWGQGEREVVGASDEDTNPDPDDALSANRNAMLRDRILNFAKRRGLPVVFPLLDSEDLALVSFSDIWGGFDEELLAASARYDVDSVLIGRVRAGSLERNRWHYYFGPEQRVWNGEPEFAVMQVADMLAGEFAIRGDAPVRTVDLNISGIFSIEAYGGVQDVLEGVSVIDSFRIAEVAGDTMRLEVDAVGGAERLARALRLAGLLEEERFDPPVGFGGTEPTTLDFYYNP